MKPGLFLLALAAALVASEECQFNGCKCGRRQPHLLSAGKMGKDPAKSNNWPWLLSLSSHSMPIHGGHFCGAGAIRLSDDIEGSDIIITATHCIQNKCRSGRDVYGRTLCRDDVYENQAAPNIDQLIFVRGGDHNLIKIEGQEEFRKVLRLRTPTHGSAWRCTDWPGSDIAVLKLDKKLEFNSVVQPACLPAPNSKPSPNAHLFLVGWGIYIDHRDPAKLQNFRNRFLAQYNYDIFDAAHFSHDMNALALKQALDEGLARRPNTPYVSVMKPLQGDLCNGILPHGEICAGNSTASAQACAGDSGGPLVEDKGSWFEMVGVTSRILASAGSTRCFETGPSGTMFAKVSEFIPFIKESICAMSDYASQLPYCKFN